jgi:hypothetical protein
MASADIGFYNLEAVAHLQRILEDAWQSLVGAAGSNAEVRSRPAHSATRASRRTRPGQPARGRDYRSHSRQLS